MWWLPTNIWHAILEHLGGIHILEIFFDTSHCWVLKINLVTVVYSAKIISSNTVPGSNSQENSGLWILLKQLQASLHPLCVVWNMLTSVLLDSCPAWIQKERRNRRWGGIVGDVMQYTLRALLCLNCGTWNLVGKKGIRKTTERSC